MTVRINDWQADGVVRCLAASSRKFVGLMADGVTVLKYLHVKTFDGMEALYEEAARYDRLGLHENLVTCKGTHADALLFSYCERGSLRDLLDDGFELSDELRSSVGQQVVGCLIWFHGQNFIHCDLNISNVFVTSDFTAKVGDLQSQLYRPDGGIEMPTMSQENAKSRHPWAGEEFSVKSDIFALGTLLYHLWHGEAPFPDLEEQTQEDEVQARYRNGERPIDVVSAMGMDGIIAKCWTSRPLGEEKKKWCRPMRDEQE
ncbi:hypothetical protein LTR95_008678 [Oleoguttula sp. CCFEE 5521]